jgi:hypothetical protein
MFAPRLGYRASEAQGVGLGVKAGAIHQGILTGEQLSQGPAP